MTTQRVSVRQVPSDDHLWLMSALRNVLGGNDLERQAVPQAVFVREPGTTTALPTDIPHGTAVMLHTSGSTGTPKFVALGADAIRASAEATHAYLGGPGQWLITLPTHRIAGLQMMTRSIIAETDPLFLGGSFSTQRFFDLAARLTGERRYVSLVPVQLARLLDAATEKQLHTLRSFDAVLVGGQAVALALRMRAHDAGINLVRTYGMTETSGGVVYDGTPIGDARMRVRDGEVQLAGPTLALGYADEPERTARSFITELGADGTPERWFRTGDSGTMMGGVLTVTGRLDRVCISGGVNVSLDEVERVLHERSEWIDVVAVATPNPEWGERVVLVTSAPELRDHVDEMTHVLKESLGPAATPHAVHVTEALPRLDNGKPHYRAILASVLDAKERA